VANRRFTANPQEEIEKDVEVLFDMLWSKRLLKEMY
jgi:hypothetical protein